MVKNATIEDLGAAIAAGATGTAAPEKPKLSGRRAARFGDEQVITVLVTENPKTPGKKCRARFDAYGGLKGHTITVAKALKAGVRRDDLIWDAEREFISVK